MTTFEPVKRKHHPGAARRFQAGLFIWFLVLMLIYFHPPLWFLPPLTFLNPVLYLAVLFLWIPFALFNIRCYGFRVLTGLLIAGCALALVISVVEFMPSLLASQTANWTMEQVTGTPLMNYSTEGCQPLLRITSLTGFPLGVVTDYAAWCHATFIYYLF